MIFQSQKYLNHLIKILILTKISTLANLFAIIFLVHRWSIVIIPFYLFS